MSKEHDEKSGAALDLIDRLDGGCLDGVMVPLRKIGLAGTLLVLRHLNARDAAQCLIPLLEHTEALWTLLNLFRQLGDVKEEVAEFMSSFRWDCFPLAHCTAQGHLETLDLLCTSFPDLVLLDPGAPLVHANLILPEHTTLLTHLAGARDLRSLVFWQQRLPRLFEELRPHLLSFALVQVYWGRVDWLDHLLGQHQAQLASDLREEANQGRDLYLAVLGAPTSRAAALQMLASLLLAGTPCQDPAAVYKALCLSPGWSQDPLVFKLLLAHPVLGVEFRALGSRPHPDRPQVVQELFGQQSFLAGPTLARWSDENYFPLKALPGLAPQSGQGDVQPVAVCLRRARQLPFFNWGLRQPGCSWRSLLQCLLATHRFWEVVELAGIDQEEVLPLICQHVQTTQQLKELFCGPHATRFDRDRLRAEVVVLDGRAWSLERLAVFMADPPLLRHITSHPLFHFPRYLGSMIATLHWVTENCRLPWEVKLAYLDCFCHPNHKELWARSIRRQENVFQAARKLKNPALLEQLMLRLRASPVLEGGGQPMSFEPEALLAC